MGTMGCIRMDCENVMCDIYVKSIGYICYECKSEFKQYLEKNGLNPTTEGQIKNELQKFMKTSKNAYTEGKETTVDDFFDKCT